MSRYDVLCNVMRQSVLWINHVYVAPFIEVGGTVGVLDMGSCDT